MVGLFVQIGSDDLTKWAGESGDWVPMEAEAQMSYIDLTKNPEVNKGYVPPPLVGLGERTHQRQHQSP